MNCPTCNADLMAGAAFCQACGTKLTNRKAVGAVEVPHQAMASGRVTRGVPDVPEETLWEGTYSPKAMYGAFLFGGVISVALVVGAFLTATTNAILSSVLLGAIVLVWAILGIQLAVKRLSIRYRLTSHSFFHREGILNRVTDRIELIEVRDVTWSQGIIQRMLDVGTLTITSGDQTHPMLPLKGIEKVEYVASLIDKARRGEQVRRGRRIDFSNIDHQT